MTAIPYMLNSLLHGALYVMKIEHSPMLASPHF